MAGCVFDGCHGDGSSMCKLQMAMVSFEKKSDLIGVVFCPATIKECIVLAVSLWITLG